MDPAQTLNSPKNRFRVLKQKALVSLQDSISFASRKLPKWVLRVIYSHGLRSLLTVLGIVIGVAAGDRHAGS